MKNQHLLKYIPKELHKHILGDIDVWKNDGEHYNCISVCFDLLDNDGEQTGFVAHGIVELKWACKEVVKGRRGGDIL